MHKEYLYLVPRGKDVNRPLKDDNDDEIEELRISLKISHVFSAASSVASFREATDPTKDLTSLAAAILKILIH